ncbi:MAG: acyl-CoA thioesterase [Ignavibacteriales bacterium]
MKINETEITVRYVETDKMGIVHHSNYFAWFEVGRTEFVKQLGMTYSEMEAKQVSLPLVECGSKFKIPAKYEDELIIKTSIEQLEIVKIQFKYEIIRKADAKLIAEGFTLHAFVDESFKPINLKKKNIYIWNVLQRGQLE